MKVYFKVINLSKRSAIAPSNIRSHLCSEFSHVLIPSAHSAEGFSLWLDVLAIKAARLTEIGKTKRARFLRSQAHQAKYLNLHGQFGDEPERLATFLALSSTELGIVEHPPEPTELLLRATRTLGGELVEGGEP